MDEVVDVCGCKKGWVVLPLGEGTLVTCNGANRIGGIECMMKKMENEVEWFEQM